MKIKLNGLPEGFEIRNGKVVKTMRDGGYITGDQYRDGSYGLVTVPTAADGSELSLPSMPEVRYSLNPVPREEANIEAEKGETVLTDLDQDGTFELYDILGKRHTGGGTPLNLPPQSFIYSDTSKAKLNKNHLTNLGITSKKKITPAKASKHFDLNKYIGAMADPHADKISDRSAELMLEKNKMSLSHLAFIQEERKMFEEGVPLAAHPWLVSQGVDPIEFSAQVQEINRQEAEAQAIAQLPPEQQAQIMMMQEFMQQANQQPQGLPAQPPQQVPLDQMAQAEAMHQQQQAGMPAPGPQFGPPMARRGGSTCYKAQAGTEVGDEALYEWIFNSGILSSPEYQQIVQTAADQGLDEDWIFQQAQGLYDAAMGNSTAQPMISSIPTGITPYVPDSMQTVPDSTTAMQTMYDANPAVADSSVVQAPSQVVEEEKEINLQQRPTEEQKTEILTVGEGGDYIDKIIDYELNHGAFDGTGLSINSAFFDGNKPGATREDARKLIETDYAPSYDWAPDELKGRVVDFAINSEDPRASLMVAAGVITPEQKVALYDGVYRSKTGASMPNTDKVDELWEKNKDNVMAVAKTPQFIEKFDAEKHRSYAGTRGASTSYAKSWGPRVDMWQEDFDYDSWTDNKYYKKDANGNYAVAKTEVEDQVTVKPEADATVATVDEKEEVVTEAPDWKKGYDQYKEYWESDKNKTLRKGMYDAYVVRAKENGKTPLTQDKFNELWLREQKQKRYFDSLPDDQVGGEDWDTSYDNGVYKGKNWRYQQEIENAPDDLEFTALTDDEIGHTQLAFQGSKDVHNMAPELFEGSNLHHGGVKDETYKGWDDITKYDSWGGNTWNRQYHDLVPVEEKVVEEEVVEETPEVSLEMTKPEIGVEAQLPEAEFWLQDLMGVGNALTNKYNIKKYYPWSPLLEDREMIPTFDDPTRRIAAINEQKNISDQARAMYSGPQSLAAFTGKSSGQALKGIADTVDRVNRYNVDTANKFEGLNANMDFMVDRINTGIRRKLYDDTMLTEQNYDNAMAMANTAITRQLQNAYTNRANTYNMNTLYDQYNVDPMRGGMIEFTNPRSPYPTDNRGQSNREKQYFDFMQKHAQLYPNQTASPFPAFKWIQGDNTRTNSYNPQQMQMMQMMQGSPYGVPNMYHDWSQNYVDPYNM